MTPIAYLHQRVATNRALDLLGINYNHEPMITLAEIKAATDALAPAELRELLLFVSQRLRELGQPLSDVRLFSREEILDWVRQDEADFAKFNSTP